jgi:hypothetical protein
MVAGVSGMASGTHATVAHVLHGVMISDATLPLVLFPPVLLPFGAIACSSQFPLYDLLSSLFSSGHPR